MPVTYLEIENFKSYSGKQSVGPFKDFTSVIGPNGSGKSNLMDAMSFVLGVHSRDLRSTKMDDLIYRPPGAKRQKQTLRALVTIYFEDDEHGEIAFGRAITPAGHGEYYVNGKLVTYAQYEERLGDIGVLVKARNFLVFQGDVDSIARKTPKEMVAMLEQISTSIELQPEYEAALKAKEAAEQTVMHEYNRQKALKSERRMLKEQKEEAEKFQQLIQRKAKLQTDLFLWILYHIDSDVREQEETLVELRKELQEREATENAKGELLKDAKKKASAARRHTQAAEKKRIKQAAQVDKLEPSVIQTTEEIKSLEKKIKTTEKQLAKKEQEQERQASKIQELEQETATKKLELEQLEQDFEEIKKDAVDIVLTDEQEEEMARVQEAARVDSVQPRKILAAATRKLTAARAQCGGAQANLEEAQKSMQEAAKAVASFSERKDKLTETLEKTKRELQSTEQELLAEQQAAQDVQAKRDEYDRDIEKLNRTLRDAKDHQRKSKDEERMAEAVQNLKRHFPGVQGRLVELCRPTQKRFNLAITVAAGREMDSIVVDNKQTAIDCMKYLKEHRVGTATFLPLETIQVPSNEQLERTRALTSNDERYRMAFDIISCDAYLKPAVLYAVGTTVVCDDLDCAREICFGRGGNNQQSRLKAVTLGGGVISKAGTMTGGITKEDTKDAGRWGTAEIEKLREKKEQLEIERSELDAGGRERLGGSIGRSSRIEELRNNVGSLQNKQNFAKNDLQYSEKQLREKQALTKSLDRQVKKLTETISNLEKEIVKHEKDVKKAGEDVKKAEDKHLAPFRKKTGLKDFKAYEQAVGERRKEFNDKKRELLEHITQLEQQVNFESSRDYKKAIEQLEKRIEESQAKLKTKKKELKTFSKQVDEAKAELVETATAVSEANDAEKATDEEVQTAQGEFSEAQNDRQKASKAVSNGEAALERLRGKLHETLQKARVEEVELPMIEDGGNRGESARSDDSDEEMDEDDESPHSSTQGASQIATQFSASDNAKVVKDRRDASKVDYSQLDEHLKERPSDREEKRMRKDFEDQLNKINAEIESTTPNMKAAEAFGTITEKLKETTGDFETAKNDARKAAKAFQAVKTKRAKLFNDAFNHIDDALKTIYTDMTKSSKHPLGGNAYLSLEDTEEPYKGGMKFNAMPPMKRFRDMEQLSGGEKTVAALSLLFAIHSYHPAPFFVMDEVDAALDNVNLRKVCNYISQRSQTDFQCIVISLKDMFYEKSQSLVGVCRDVGTSSSRTLTLDLTRFDAKEGGKKKSGAKRARSSSPPKKAQRVTRSST